MNDITYAARISRRMADLHQRIEYRRARTPEDKDAIYRLRYRGYLADGGIGPNPEQSFSDPWDDADNAMVFGIYYDGQLASTIRMHISTVLGEPIPAMEIFSDVLAPYQAKGRSMIDPTRFVVEPKFAALGTDIPFATLRLVAMATQHYNVDVFLATVREEHTLLYKRTCGHRVISEPRPYPLLAKKIVCMAVEMKEMQKAMQIRCVQMISSRAERWAVFGPPEL